ncbi:potassium channel protein [Reichenbachiella agarivorans]|uniref:Potassium channel protein n=1 Tax=Reichenbachiella agarivorans TaxID=2979464 RepID=A0ABY6CQE8_9BACT|nr:potassium channel protein [Reichenbachiella agarivorans]UXP32260.1 potassium channel protein [Reichenbachiella agarivorans]
MNRQLESLITAFILFLFSLGIGLSGFILIEDLNFVNALYMTIITIGTVGFTEVKELSQAGRVFTSIYILLNLGLFAYVVSVVSSYFFEGKLKSIFKNYRSGMEISKLSNHIIVCGFGRNGRRACEELQKSGEKFVIIDSQPEIADLIPDTMRWYIGDATKDDNLKTIGIEKASTIIITTPSDAANVFITLTARYLNEKIKIIVRASNLETEDKLYRAGADKVIMPDILGGMFMAQLVTKPIVIEFLDLLNGVSGTNYHLEEVAYDQLKSQYQDKTLRELNIPATTGVIVLGVKDNVKGLIPSPSADTFIGPDDHLIVLGSQDTLNSFMKEFTLIKK